MRMITRKKPAGLSPLARGTLGQHRKSTARWRFIPAGAGNTRAAHGRTLGDAVYPRWRGEHKLPIPVNGRKNGLSPLARGTLEEAMKSWH